METAEMDAWIECAWFKCCKRFEPGRRSNGAHHTGALYCSRSCQQKAYRHRQSGVTVADAPGAGATVTLAPAPAPQPLAAPSASNARPTIHLPEGAVLSDWKLCLPSDWRTLPDLPIPAFLRRPPS